jgi:sorting nexin-29
LDRVRISDALRKAGFPEKLIRLIKITLENTTATVMVQGEVSPVIRVETGVRQGDALSTLIFIVVLHDIIGPLQKRGSIFYKTTQILAYADDIVTISRTLADLKDTVLKIDKKSREIGLSINEVKMK